MYSLYLDESGGDEHTNFVLGGLAIFEGEMRRVIGNIDAILERYFPGRGGEIELRVTALRQKAWKEAGDFTKEDYWKLLSDISDLVAELQSRRGLFLFACVVHKPSLYPGNDPYVAAFEDVVKRFDTFLVTQHKASHTHKGILILDRSSERRTNQLRQIFDEFQTEGTRWGKIHNLPEVPLFANSSATRLLQLADFVSHTVFRRYELNYAQHFDKILRTFYQDDNDVIHGLGHIIRKKEHCMCISCFSRKKSPQTS